MPSLSVPLFCLFFQSVPLSIPRQTLPSVPISLRLARPLPFHPDDPATAPFLLSVWLNFTQMPLNLCPVRTTRSPHTVYPSPSPPSPHLSISVLFIYFCVSCLLSPSVFLFLIFSHCTDAWLGLQQLSRHVPLPSVAVDCRAELGGGGGGLGMEGAQWISHEYSCPLVCTTKQKMAPWRRLHPSKKGEESSREKRKEETEERKNRESQGKVMEEWWVENGIH